MKISYIHSFLVHPGKGLEEQPPIRGANVPLAGKLFAMLSDQTLKADEHCDIDISFNPALDGKQQNDCRDDILAALKSPSLEHSRKLASRLQNVTTNRSGLGLFFVIVGHRSKETSLYIARFPADFAILAEESKSTLKVEFLEKVFMRNDLKYKAVVYHGSSYANDFWLGKAVDKQINGETAISNYWIRDFLLSDFRTTGAAGTQRLARALKDAMDSSGDLNVKSEISAAALLAPNLDGEVVTIDNFGSRFGLSEPTKIAVVQQLRKPSLRVTSFQFSSDEFQKTITFKSLELNNGAILTARLDKFDECFQQTVTDRADQSTEFRTIGRVINERLRKTK